MSSEVREEKIKILGYLTEAVNRLEENSYFSKLIPEVRTNLVYSISEAYDIGDVAGIDGRITVVRGFPRAAGSPMFGASDHMARAILEIRKYNPSLRSGINLRYNNRVKRVMEEYADERSLEIGEIDRESEPEESKKGKVKSMPWKINYLYNIHDDIPKIFYETAGRGKEPLYVILGENPVDVVDESLEISSRI